MAFIYEYELKKPSDREKVDLTRYSDEIKSAVESTFNDNLIEFNIQNSYFRFTLSSKATDLDKRNMGRRIVSNNRELNSLKTQYAYSSQLFVGKEYISEESINIQDGFSINIKDIMFDERSKCYSVLTKMRVNEYLNLVRDAYNQNGRIEGQRDKLKTTTASRIYNRLIDDVKLGAVLPPIVIGILLQKNQIDIIESWDISNTANTEVFSKIIHDIDQSRISIIDGMQRTTAFLENENYINDKYIRVEFWIAKETRSLTYRMLILNTGQIPWNLRRQIEVVFSSILSELQEFIFQDLDENISIFKIDDSSRRTQAGQYQADKIMELYLAFSLRKEQIDMPEKLANEFSRLDMIESVSNQDFFDTFTDLFKCFIKLDLLFGRYKDLCQESRFNDGRDLFGSQPVCIGFFAAAAQKIYGRPGEQKAVDHQERALTNIINRCNYILEILSDVDSAKAAEILAFETLNELISKNKTSSNIGDYERKFFTEAFRLFFADDYEANSLLPCWRNF